MLEQIVGNQSVLGRLEASVLGPMLEGFVCDMRVRGHSERTIRDYVREAGHLAQWMAEQGCTVEGLNESAVEAFLMARVSPRGAAARAGARRKARAAVGRLVSTLHSRGMLKAPAPLPSSPVDALLQQFWQHSMDCRGAGSATCQQQSRYVREFLMTRVSLGGEIDLARITARDLMDFVVHRAGRGQTMAAKHSASALRAFLRFLALHARCAASLCDAVPTVVHRGPRLPRHLDRDQVRQLLESFDRSSPAGRRDYAMALCMVRLGLRVGEVVALRLGDIAWRDGTLRIVTSKSRRAATLPLPTDVGRALSDYLRAGRPAAEDRHVFLTHVVPVGRQLDACAARAAVRRAFDRSGLQVNSKGTHTLRHTVATTMVCEGASLKEIADVLRHRSLDTTAVYARVDLSALSAVALPWPEVRP